jgi:hypothetical protein
MKRSKRKNMSKYVCNNKFDTTQNKELDIFKKLF